MKSALSSQRLFLLIVLMTAVGFVLWLAAIYVIWQILRSAGIEADYWSITEALSTAIAAVAVLSAGYVAYRELSEVASTRHIEIADRLFNELNSESNIAARRWIYHNLTGDPETDIHELPPEGQAAIKQVLNSLDRVAFLTQTGWIPDDIIMPWMHPMIAKSWARLEPYVLFERDRRNEPYYYRYAGELAERCRKWRMKHLNGDDTRWVEDAL